MGKDIVQFVNGREKSFKYRIILLLKTLLKVKNFVQINWVINSLVSEAEKEA